MALSSDNDEDATTYEQDPCLDIFTKDNTSPLNADASLVKRT